MIRDLKKETQHCFTGFQPLWCRFLSTSTMTPQNPSLGHPKSLVLGLIIFSGAVQAARRWAYRDLQKSAGCWTPKKPQTKWKNNSKNVKKRKKKKHHWNSFTIIKTSPTPAMSRALSFQLPQWRLGSHQEMLNVVVTQPSSNTRFLHLISYFFKHDLTLLFVPSPSRNRNIALTMGTTGTSLSESKWLKSSEVWEDKPRQARHSIHREYGVGTLWKCTPKIYNHPHKNTRCIMGTRKISLWIFIRLGR